MAAHFSRSAQLGVLFAVAFLCVASAAGNGGYEAGAKEVGVPTRHLLQTETPCPVDFGTQNYTGVTSVCNGTNPNTTACCEAFVVFACPFAPYINDESTNCDTTMFSYLNLAGNYPPQLFQTCQGDENGLPCPLVPAPSPNPSSAAMDAVPWRLLTSLMEYALMAGRENQIYFKNQRNFNRNVKNRNHFFRGYRMHQICKLW